MGVRAQYGPGSVPAGFDNGQMQMPQMFEFGPLPLHACVLCHRRSEETVH